MPQPKFAPVLLRVLTSSSLLHPTRLSMICARLLRRLSIPEQTAGLETCSNRSFRARTPTAEKLLELEKEPHRKAVFRSARWPAQSFVTIPYRGPFFFIPPPPIHKQVAPEGVRFLRSPIRRLAQNTRERPTCARANAGKTEKKSSAMKYTAQAVANKTLIYLTTTRVRPH